jgi:hypothetical protein
MKKYRKKPLVIEAMKWDGTEACMSSLKKFIPGKELGNIWYGSAENDGDKHELCIKTLGGIMTADMGDYIIVGIQKELYPCKPDIFEASYEEVE